MISYDKISVSDEGQEMAVSDELMEDKEAATDSEMLFKEKRKALSEALGILDDTSRLLIEFFYVREMSYKEMVMETGMDVGSIKSVLFRAKKKLGVYVARAYPELLIGDGLG